MGKKHLSWSPGQVKFQPGQAYYFIQCLMGKKMQCNVIFP